MFFKDKIMHNLVYYAYRITHPWLVVMWMVQLISCSYWN